MINFCSLVLKPTTIDYFWACAALKGRKDFKHEPQKRDIDTGEIVEKIQWLRLFVEINAHPISDIGNPVSLTLQSFCLPYRQES
jgi:hypothetical protein